MLHLLPFLAFVAIVLWLKVLEKNSSLAEFFGKVCQLFLFYYVLWAYFSFLHGFSKEIGKGKRDKNITFFFSVLWLQTCLFTVAILTTEWSRGILLLSSIPWNLGVNVLILSLPFLVASGGLCAMFVWLGRVYRDGFTD